MVTVEMSDDATDTPSRVETQPTIHHRREDGDSAADVETTERLRDQVRRLENKNQRLQQQYESTQQSRSRQTVIGLAVVGGLAAGAAYLVPSAQEVLFTIAATGLFAAVLAYTLTPDRFVPVDIGEGIYESLALNEQAVADELGLSNTRVYATTNVGPRLFVPEIDAYDRAVVDGQGDGDVTHRLSEPFVVSDLASQSGLALRPTARTLLSSFTDDHGNTLPENPADAAVALQEGVTEVFELARKVTVDVDAADGRVTFAVKGQLFGPLTRFDHPVASFFGAGLAEALSQPIELSVEETDAGSFVTCRWAVDAAADVESESESESESEPDAESTSATDTADDVTASQ